MGLPIAFREGRQMNLTQVWKSGLAVMFACAMSFALVGCDNGSAPAPTGDTTTESGEEGGSAAGAGEAVPE